MLKKLSKYESFYHGINLDDWFKDKAKVINLLINKSNQVLDKTPYEWHQIIVYYISLLYSFNS